MRAAPAAPAPCCAAAPRPRSLSRVLRAAARRPAARAARRPQLPPRCCADAGAGALPLPPATAPPPLSARRALLRRVLLGGVTLRLALFTPAPALATSLVLGLLASALASRAALMPAAVALRDALAAALPPAPPPQPGDAAALSPSPLLRGAALSPARAAAVGFAVYIAAGLLEIGGGWLVWQALRCGKPRWWAAVGSALLVGYGFVAALQPVASFGRAFALYGGYFVLMSVAWGAALDGFRPDAGDAVGCALIAAGVVIMSAWPRS
jgi:small multidrug resistance family-3 protein